MNCSSSLCCFQNYCIRRIVVWFVIQFIICLFTFKIISLQDSLAACLIKLFKLRDDKFFLIRSHVRRLMGIFFCTSLYAFFSFFFSRKIYAHLFMRAYLWLQLAYISWLMYPDLLISSVFARTLIYFFLFREISKYMYSC